MPWFSLPSGAKGEREALLSKYKQEQSPVLVLVDPEARILTVNGVSMVTSDPAGENFPWGEEQIPTLTDTDILVKMGPLPPQPGEVGVKGIFINNKNYLKMGLVDQEGESDDVPFSGNKRKPYCEYSKQAALEEVKRVGFMSDFHPAQKDIEKFTGDSLLFMYDPESAYGDKVVWTTTLAAYNREKERLEERRQEIISEFNAAVMGKGEGGGEEADKEEPEESIVVRDEPKACGEWSSPTMVATHAEVRNFKQENQRPLLQIMITRPRAHFGKNWKFSDSGENIHNCRPQKDPNFAMQRKELEIGIQAVKEVRDAAAQTTWFRPVNKSTQYSANDFLQRDRDLGYEKVNELTEFLSAVSVSVEEALQTNETVDIFQEEFAHLGEEEAGAVSKTNSNIKEFRNFQDLTYTKGKRIEWIEWVPNSVDMLACSCCENLPFSERCECAGKATVSTILVWSFQDSLAPHAILLAPWEVAVFKFYPSNEKYVVAGLGSGQLAAWKLTDADLGHAMRERSKREAPEEERTTAIPSVTHKVLSMIDESHRRPITAIEWLPPALELERRGRGASEKNARDGPAKYFATAAGDGQVMIWDFQALLDSINDTDFVWRPVHRVQLNRQDSGTEMGLCQLLYCHDRYDEKGGKQLTNFFASTEEGELIFGDWAARAEEDRKPELVKRLYNVSKTYRPMLALERSPFFPDVLLGVTDWAFYLWRDGVQEHLFQSSYSSVYFTRGAWSPTRPSVAFLGLVSGGIDIWDFSDQSHKASLSDSGASVAISSMAFLRHGDAGQDQKLAVGDAQGHLHVHVMPKNLVRQAGKELDNMRRFLDREEQRVKYFRERRQELGELREQLEKKAQMAEDADEADKGKSAVDEEKQDAHAEEIYKKLEEECVEQLKQQGSGF